MTTKKDPATVSLASKKGLERADRLRARARYLRENATGYIARGEESAISWVLARLAKLEAERERPPITQARAVEIIEAWSVDEVRDHNGRPVLDGLDLDELGIG